MANDPTSDEDKALFRNHMRSVTPLNKQTPRIKEAAIPPIIPPPKRVYQASTQTPTQDYYLSDFITETVLTHSVLSYCHPGIPTKRFKALVRGEIPWESRLDLHGSQTETAKASLTRFIQTQAQNNKRCLLIIHGKGGHSNAPPVIKNLVNRWLPQFREILAFHSAQAKDGGHGAVYVLLKRNREDDLR